MKKLKAVCVGAGYFSQFHYEAWQRMDNVEVIAICDTDKKLAKEVADQYGISGVYTNVSKMLENCQADFIDIITPPKTHLTICTLAAKAGLDIICQKPLAPSIDDAARIAKLEKEYGIGIMVHENFRFQPWHRELKKLLDNNTIGNVVHSITVRMRMGDGWQKDAYMSRQPYFREMPQLLIYETGIHFIDVFRYLLGDIASVNAVLKTLNTNIKGEDFAWVHFEFANGSLGFLDANRYNESNAKNPRLTFGYWQIDGEAGSLRLYEDGKLTIQKLGEPESTHIYDFTDVNFAGDCVYATQHHFITCLLNHKRFETNVFDYMQNMKCQEAIYVSNKMR